MRFSNQSSGEFGAGGQSILIPCPKFSQCVSFFGKNSHCKELRKRYERYKSHKQDCIPEQCLLTASQLHVFQCPSLEVSGMGSRVVGQGWVHK